MFHIFPVAHGGYGQEKRNHILIAANETKGLLIINLT